MFVFLQTFPILFGNVCLHLFTLVYESHLYKIIMLFLVHEGQSYKKLMLGLALRMYNLTIVKCGTINAQNSLRMFVFQIFLEPVFRDIFNYAAAKSPGSSDKFWPGHSGVNVIKHFTVVDNEAGPVILISFSFLRPTFRLFAVYLR